LEQKRVWTGLGFATASALSFALLNVAIRYSEPYLSVWQIMFARSVFGVAVMLPLGRLWTFRLWGRGRKTLLLAGVTNLVNVIALTTAIFLLPLFQALVLLYLYPLFAALISPLINGDRFDGGDWGLIVLGLAGTVLVLWPGEMNGGLSLGHLLGLGAAFSYGLTTTLIRRIVSVNSPLVPFFYVSIVGSVVCALPALTARTPFFALPPHGWAILCALCVCGASAYLCSNKALGYLPSPKVGVISMTEVVFSALFGLLLFHEQPGPLALAGGVLILASGVALSRKPGRPSEAY